MYSDFVAQPHDWFRIHLVALIVSIIVGLPIFFMTLDLFGHALGPVKLPRPHVTIRTKVFLIGALVPLLVDTMLVQYYWTRTGYFTFETFSVWLVLEFLAIIGSLIFVRSFGQSLSPLAGVVDSGQGSENIDISGLVPQSTDELGVLAAGYSEILQELRIRNDLLELRNRILRESGTGATLARTLHTVLAASQEVVLDDTVVVLLHDREAAALVAVAQTGRGYRAEGHFRISLPQPARADTTQEIRSGETIEIDSAFGSHVTNAVGAALAARSMTANPLVINSVVIGLLVTVNTIVEKSYSVRERMLLEGLAQEAALTIHTQSLEHQREERDAHIRLLLDSTVGAIYGVDLEGRCTFVNRVCLNMLGYENEAELLGRNVHNLIHRPPADGGSQPEHDRTGQGIVPTPDTLHGDDHVHWRRNGSSFPVEYWTRPIYRDGELTGTIVTFLDISERKQAQEALLRSEERYALAQHAANIGSWEYLRRVRAAAQRMALLIDDLLSLSRLTRRELHEDDVDLTAIAREVVSELRRVAPHRKAVIEIAPGLQARGDAR